MITNVCAIWLAKQQICNTAMEFVVPFPLALKSSWKSHLMTPFFIQIDVLGEKIIIWVKYGNVFTQIMMFSLKKVDDLRAREQEEKGATNSAPRTNLQLRP